MILPALFLLHAQGFLLPARDRSTVCPNASARPCRRAVDPCSWVLFATLLEERASFHVSGAYPVSRYADECLWFCPFVAAADPTNDLLLLESFEPPESGFVGHPPDPGATGSPDAFDDSLGFIVPDCLMVGAPAEWYSARRRYCCGQGFQCFVLRPPRSNPAFYSSFTSGKSN